MGGLENLFFIEFWQEYYQFTQMVLNGNAPIGYLVMLNMMVVVVLIMIIAPIWLSVSLYRLTKEIN